MQYHALVILAVITAIGPLFIGCIRKDSRPYQAAIRPPTADEMDYEVISVILDALHKDTEFNLCRVDPLGPIAFALHTPTTNEIDDVVVSTLSPHFQKMLGVHIHKDMIGEFICRNTQSAEYNDFTPSNTNIVVLPDLKDISWGLITGAGDMPPDCRGGIASYLPAYSADMTTAIVVFICFPNYHNAPAGTYYLRKIDNGWVVQAGNIWMYM